MKDASMNTEQPRSNGRVPRRNGNFPGDDQGQFPHCEDTIRHYRHTAGRLKERFMRTVLYAGLLACAVAPAACRPAPAAVQSDNGQQVKIDNLAFWPERLAIAKDTTITWTNKDD